ncbi:VWA domain-containing protein [Herpetosiphon sp. NSE202]|uniref:VWA domain-containing protein n=1 Tax=Herpetosiphon sp. NSE202 TaxID=3351349 RepID=UPI00363C2AC7
MSNQAMVQLRITPGRPAVAQSNDPQIVYLLVEASPSGIPDADLAIPVNLGFIVDRSSSMRGERLYQVKEACNNVVNQLNRQDYFSVVSFNDRAEVVVPCQRPNDKDQIKRAIGMIEAKGGTEMATGMMMGLQEISRPMMSRGISRMVLLTDGRTYGDESRCVEIARRAQSKGIGITALGIGDEWNEDLLETIASAENSRTEYITNAQQIVNVFSEEIKRLQNVMAHKVELRFHLHPQAEIRSLFRVRPFIAALTPQLHNETLWRMPLGEWVGREDQVFLLELVVPPMPAGNQTICRVEMFYEVPSISSQALQTKVDVQLPIRSAEQIRPDVDGVVKHWLERTVAYRLQASAWQHVEQGNIEEATKKLRMAGTRLLESGQTDLAQTVQEEATRLLRSGTTSDEGRKRIKYGTRGLVARERGGEQ